MELFSSCKIPEIYEANIINIIMSAKKYDFLAFFYANIHNMRILSIILCVTYWENKRGHLYVPSYNFLYEFNFENLYEFFNFAKQLYQDNIKILSNFCCEFKEKKYPNNELIEKWLIDGHIPCTNCIDNEYYTLFYDYIYEHYTEKFGDSFRLFGYIGDDIYCVDNEYNISRFVQYVNNKKIDVELLYSNKYISSSLYSAYLDHIPYFSKEVHSDDLSIDLPINKEVKYYIDFVITKGKTCTITLPYSTITRDLDNNYMLKICNKINPVFYINFGLQPVCNCCNKRRVAKNTVSVNIQILQELEEYILTTEDNDSNFIVINRVKHLNNINLTNNTIIYYLNEYNNYIDISEYYDIIKILFENNELNNIIFLLNGYYTIFNEPWFIATLKCTIEPRIEIIDIYNSIESDKLKYQFIKLILNKQ